MFFKREKLRIPAFNEILDSLRKQGFAIENEAGGVRVSKAGIGALVKERSGSPPEIGKAGVILAGEIGVLVDAGYQKYWLTPKGVKAAATADHLHALHDFEEDLRETLGLISLYNESLGTTNELHLYDRVKDRDFGTHRPWDR